MRWLVYTLTIALASHTSLGQLTIDFIGYHNATRSAIYNDSSDNDQGGMMMVFVRNTSTSPIDLTEWRINGVNAATLVTNGTIQWQRIWPKTIAPGQTAVAQAKAMNTPIKSGANVNVQILGSGGATVSGSATLSHPKLRLGSISASEDMKTVYVFLRNTDTVDYTVTRVWMNDEVTSQCTFVGSPTVTPNGVGIIKVAFDTPIAPMTHFAFRVEATKPDASVVQVGSPQRLNKPFIAVGTWSTDLFTSESGQQYAKNLQINLAAESTSVTNNNLLWSNYNIGTLVNCRTGTDPNKVVNTSLLNSAKGNPAFKVWMLADEPDLSGSEPRQNFVDHNEQVWELDPSTPTYINLCKNYRFAQYCHIPDIISMDHYVMYAPNIITGGGAFEETFEYAKVLKDNCEPKLMWVWPQLVLSSWSNQPTDWGVNLQFWTQIMMGAKGYTWFRYAPGNENNSSYIAPINEAIQVGKEFAQVKNIVFYGDVADIVSVSNSKVRSRAIVGEEAMVVVLTNYNYSRNIFTGSYSISPSTTNVSVTVPDWIPLEDVYRVTASGRTSAAHSISGRTVAFSNVTVNQDSFVYVIGKTDATPPAKVKGLHFAQVTSPTEFVLAWQDGMDNYGIAGYKVYQNGVEIADVKQPLYKTTSGVNIAGEWTVRAYDSAGNLSQPCLSVSSSRIAILFNNNDDMEGCYFNNNSVNIAIQGGTLAYEIIGSNQYIFTPKVSFDASQYRYLRVKLRNGTPGTGLRMNWITPDDSSYNQTKSGVVSFPPNQTTMQESFLDLTTRPAWTGTIMNPRLIPAISTSSGTMEIDYVILQAVNPAWVGDADGNGRVDLEDFATLASNYGQDVIGWEQGDFTGDRTVGDDDLLALASRWLYQY